MGEIVNLRRIKKRLTRQADAEQAAANRAAHGRTKAEKGAAEVERRAADRVLDGARLVRDGEPRE